MKKFSLKIQILYYLFFFIVPYHVSAQDPEFTQFYANPLFLNPANAGTAKGFRLASTYRNQWPTISMSFVTYSVSCDHFFNKLNGGLGFQFLYDRAATGNFTTVSGSLIYSYLIPVTENFTINTGLQFSLAQQSIDYNRLWDLTDYGQVGRFNSIEYQTGEPVPAGVYKNPPFLDFSVGFLGYTDKFYAGFAASHISEPQVAFREVVQTKLARKYTSHVGIMVPLDSKAEPSNFFSPNVIFLKQDNFEQMNFGAYYIRDFIVCGMWYRLSSNNSDAFITSLGVKKGAFQTGYSYDVTISRQQWGGRGSHEVTLLIVIPAKSKLASSRWRKLNCPSF